MTPYQWRMGRRLLVIFGSETGTAEDVAVSFARSARRRLFETHVCAGEDVILDELLEPLVVVFVCSTTGDGEMPENMRPLWRFFLRADLPADLFSKMQFCVFGIGSRQYVKCVEIQLVLAFKLQRRLEQLGACEIHVRGEADEQDVEGVWGALMRWSEPLWTILEEKYPLPVGYRVYADDVLLPASFSVLLNKPKTVEIELEETREKVEVKGKIKAKVLENVRITAKDHWQDVRHVVLGVDRSVKYRSGDRVILYPRNPEKEVCTLLEYMGWAEIADIPLYIVSKERGKPGVPSNASLRYLFTNVFDFLSVPRQSFFEFLVYFTDNQEFAEKMRYFCVADGQEDLYSYVNWPRRTILEVIQDFYPLNIPLDYIFDVFPVIRGRKFSITSSPMYKTVLREFRYGVCTRWVSVLSKEIDFSPGTLKKAESCMVPVVMVGPGTGVSPLRSLIQERIFEGCKDNILFFGCRFEHKDFLFKDEWMEHCNNGNLVLFTAFSRDQNKKRYVQHIMEEHSKIVYDYLYNKRGILYLSGNSRFMPEAVKQAFLNILIKEGNFTIEKSKAYLLEMEKGGRYMQETWS
ncbi:hypothetical protein PMAC_002175 [Pneumocystis sp. 'macacae']|nr:hypothetical protein PMAC_002175 [Pneumocystis sp. 'macacae']